MSRTRDLSKLINGIAADKITSGSLDSARIPNLSTAKITSGTFANTRLSSGSVTQHVDLSSIDSDYIQLRQATADLTQLSASNLTSGTVPAARLALSASDVPDLATSKITSGTFADARISSSSVTAHVSAVTTAEGSYTVSYNNFAATTQSSYYVRAGNICHVHVYFYRTGYTSTSNLSSISLPFTSVNSGHIVGGGNFAVRDAYEKGLYTFVYKNDNKMYFRSGYGTQVWDHGSSSATFTGDDWSTHGNRYVMCHCTYAIA